jgi:hypothetical protein
LHLTIGVNVFRWIDMVREALLVAAEENVGLREAVPSRFLEPGAPAEDVSNQLGNLLGGLPWNSYGPRAVGRLSDRLFNNAYPAPDGHFASLDRLHEIDSATVFVRRSGMTCSVFAKDGKAVIRFPGNQMSGPPSIEPALTVIAKLDRLCAHDLPGSLTDEAKLVLLRRLVKEGLLSIA